MLVQKKLGKQVHAYELNMEHPHPVLKKLMSDGLVIPHDNGTFEIKTREACEKGEIALAGDFVKIDPEGAAYPNKRDFFLQNHRHIFDDVYEQIPQPVFAWTVADGVCEEIFILMDQKGLRLNEKNLKQYFSAPLWGTVETAPEDSVILFYSISRDTSGAIIDADFNFVCRSAFEDQYIIID